MGGLEPANIRPARFAMVEATDVGLKECLFCFEKGATVGMLQALSCGHGPYCCSCIEKYTESLLRGGQCQARCPECDAPIAPQDLFRLIPRALVDRLEAESIRQGAADSGEMFACPTPTCGMIVSLAKDDIPRLKCPSCRKESCLLCKVQPFHWGVSCEEAKLSSAVAQSKKRTRSSMTPGTDDPTGNHEKRARAGAKGPIASGFGDAGTHLRADVSGVGVGGLGLLGADVTALGPRPRVDPVAQAQFMGFLRCQLRMETRHCFSEEVCAACPAEQQARLWERYQNFAHLDSPGRLEKWVPLHFGVGVHERFIAERIHHAYEPSWELGHGWRRFLVMFIFRAHCCSAMFLAAQLRLLRSEIFWESPRAAFAPGGAMEQSMLRYRLETRRPLQTGAFRIIPERVCSDNDENLARNVCKRTCTLIGLAQEIFPKIQSEMSKAVPAAAAPQLYDEIYKIMVREKGIGDTWAKMLMVSIDFRYPSLELLLTQCEVGCGAEAGLRRLFPGDSAPLREQLRWLTADLNSPATKAIASDFWELLRRVERLGRAKCEGVPLLLDHLREAERGLSAATIQVQLCEWRQFLDHVARSSEPPQPPTT